MWSITVNTSCLHAIVLPMVTACMCMESGQQPNNSPGHKILSRLIPSAHGNKHTVTIAQLSGFLHILTTSTRCWLSAPPLPIGKFSLMLFEVQPEVKCHTTPLGTAGAKRKGYLKYMTNMMNMQ